MRFLIGFMGLFLAALNPATLLCMMACSEWREAELPPHCSDIALAQLESGYAADVLAACKGKDFDTCAERPAIEARYRTLREEWAKCPAHR